MEKMREKRQIMIKSGKLREREGRKAMGLRFFYYDCQVALTVSVISFALQRFFLWFFLWFFLKKKGTCK